MRPILPARAPGAGQAAHLRVVQGQTVKCSSFLTMFTLSTRFPALQGAEGTPASEWRDAMHGIPRQPADCEQIPRFAVCAPEVFARWWGPARCWSQREGEIT